MSHQITKPTTARLGRLARANPGEARCQASTVATPSSTNASQRRLTPIPARLYRAIGCWSFVRHFYIKAPQASGAYLFHYIICEHGNNTGEKELSRNGESRRKPRSLRLHRLQGKTQCRQAFRLPQ